MKQPFNKYLTQILVIVLAILNGSILLAQPSVPQLYHEAHRPAFHFSPKEHWMNDPNGLICIRGTWHLFYQYYPEGTVWGPMHWGHAVSKDLVEWKHLPIALYPDSLGYIFSGSVVFDSLNSSGLGTSDHPPLVAIFTHHNPVLEQSGRTDFQYQSIAYSTDMGYSWHKYKGNPVLPNPGQRDFRDPKVIWLDQEKKWILTLAAGDHVEFYQSANLLHWEKTGAFGSRIGAHGGVWECPDLFPLKLGGKTIWTLLVSINPGGPNGGSATQYFTGDFNGRQFQAFDTITRWIDAGTDHYAGVSFSNTGNRRIIIGWMSNWDYAQVVPTQPWRSAMTIPRTLQLKASSTGYRLITKPVDELKQLLGAQYPLHAVSSGEYQSSWNGSGLISGKIKATQSLELILSNDAGDSLLIGFKPDIQELYIDRRNAGANAFNSGFGRYIRCSRLLQKPIASFDLFIDRSSVELFADKGWNALTALYFPEKPLNHLTIKTSGPASVPFKAYRLGSIW